VQTCDPAWRGYVLPSDHNYAGIGAYNGSTVYMCKPTPTLGIRAQLQHLRNYADPASTPYTLGRPFEPRVGYTEANFTTFLYHGQAPRWQDLEGRWAVPGTTYWDTISSIYNSMRASAGLVPMTNDELVALTIMGPSALTAEQIAARVTAVGNPWKPEISPLQMAQIYLDEGAASGVRGDVAFAQSILETGWFSWPHSPAAAAAESAPQLGAPTTTTPGVDAAEPVVDVFAEYFELTRATYRY
jgi:hypothetical protein